MKYLSIADYHHFNQMKYKEIAERVGVTAGYIQTLKRKGGMIGADEKTGELTLYRPVRKKANSDD